MSVHIWKSPRGNLALRLSLPPHLLHALLSPSLYFPSPSFLSFSFRPPAQQLILHAQEQTEISIHVMPHSLATPTNGSMQLGCTHSKRPFEYSSANSCIHWYLKCSGSARVLNPWYIWQNPPPQKRRKKNKDGYRDKDQDSFYCAAASNTKWRAQIGMFASPYSSENESKYTVNVHCDPLITTYNALKVCHCQNPPDHPLHICVH